MIPRIAGTVTAVAGRSRSHFEKRIQDKTFETMGKCLVLSPEGGVASLFWLVGTDFAVKTPVARTVVMTAVDWEVLLDCSIIKPLQIINTFGSL